MVRKSFQIHWDVSYGIAKRRGWSVIYDCRVLSSFEPYLIVALWKAWRAWKFILDSRARDEKEAPKTSKSPCHKEGCLESVQVSHGTH